MAELDQVGADAGQDAGGAFRFRCAMTLPFPGEGMAGKALEVLKVDQHIGTERCAKRLGVDGEVLSVELLADDPRTLRAMANATYDALEVIVATMREFA